MNELARRFSGAAFLTASGGLLTSAWVLGDLDSLRTRLGLRAAGSRRAPASSTEEGGAGHAAPRGG